MQQPRKVEWKRGHAQDWTRERIALVYHERGKTLPPPRVPEESPGD